MAFPDVTTTFDDFLRGSYPQAIYNGGGHAASWDSVAIVSGATIWSVVAAGQGQNVSSGAEAVSAAQFGPDVVFTFTFPSAPGFNFSNYFAAWISSTDNGGANTWPTTAINGYALVAGLTGVDAISIKKYPGGTTLGSSTTQTISAGDSLGIRQVGSTIEVWYKAAAGSWTMLIQVTDASYYRAGRLAIEGTGVTLSDISGGTITAGTTQVAATRRVTYNVLANVAATRRVAYNVLANVAATRRVNYAVRANVAATRRVAYNVLANVAATRRVNYAVRANVAATRRVAYNVLANVAATRAVQYTVGNVVAGANRLLALVGYGQ